MAKQYAGKAYRAKNADMGKPFEYNHLGSMASVGRYKALVDLRQSKVYIFFFPKIFIIIYLNLNVCTEN